MNDHRQSDDAFDQALRGQYRQATRQLSPNTLARLRQVRHAATLGVPQRRGFAWPLLGGAGALAAAVFAIAFGLNLRNDTLPATDATPTAVAIGDAITEPASALDQDPDFYAWLGSADAELVAME
ncbi:hypothetical protein IP90_01766 [Luteimonas cucumeris]|uniref:DUF3619 family protein n=1 Tax=Luteimonas cucumeris TaxID=985012 RepID=A0A562L4U2_9GAMM|nr:hypothetical protein [Luteimonas cucumeris]TWI02669.1 hypothetical protein IP90_01766 [Luteimonas cucumeris]